MKSIIKKAKSIINHGIDPIQEGIENFQNPIAEIEKLADERLDVCGSCELRAPEPIEFLRIKDERLPKASGKMCDDCGCTLSYKIRQTKTKCEKWQR